MFELLKIPRSVAKSSNIHSLIHPYAAEALWTRKTTPSDHRQKIIFRTWTLTSCNCVNSSCWPAEVDGSHRWGHQRAVGPPGSAERADPYPAQPSVTPWLTPWHGGWPPNFGDCVAKKKNGELEANVNGLHTQLKTNRNCEMCTGEFKQWSYSFDNTSMWSPWAWMSSLTAVSSPSTSSSLREYCLWRPWTSSVGSQFAASGSLADQSHCWCVEAQIKEVYSTRFHLLWADI